MEKFKIHKVLALLLVLAAGFTGQVQAQFQSDFQIKQNFDRDHAQVLEALKAAETAQDVVALDELIAEMDNRYRDHANLLNRVIYPETVQNRINTLQELSEATSRHIARYDQKGDTVVVLEEQIADLTADATRYQARADSLNNQLDAMRRSRNANAAQARRLRNELDKRDAFIIKMVDSTFVAYKDINLASLSPTERRDLALEIDAQNVLGFVETVIDNNISFLNTHTELSTEDFLKLYSVQIEFRRMWNNMGYDLAQIYVSETNRKARLLDIVEKIDQWEMLVDETAWATLNDAFRQNGIELASFNNSIQFYSLLNTYLDEAIKNASESRDEAHLDAYNVFANFWFNEVKPRWQEFLISANILTYDNINTVDTKLAEWKVQAQPSSNTMAILFGIALVLLLIALGLWLKEKTRK